MFFKQIIRSLIYSCPPPGVKGGLIASLTPLVLLASVWALVAIPGAFAQRSALSGGRGEFPVFNLRMELLGRADVRDELELVAHQLTQLDELQNRFRQRIRGAIAQVRLSASDIGDIREQLRVLVQEINNDFRDELDRVLLPHQSRRLSQLVTQLQARAAPVAVFFGSQVTADLQISPEQRIQMQQAAEEVDDEYRRKLAELREETQERMLRFLNPDQREAFRNLVGEVFHFREPLRLGVTADPPEASAEDEKSP